MDFIFLNKKSYVTDTAKSLAYVIEDYNRAVKDGARQYNEHRKKAEEEINSGARLTKHRINL
ncbi:hypothetical protein GCM10027155_07480 [Acinetobacter apis]|uniref:Uncharacterized protein n=1 Tax=Acinetobacter apis TaxID=1229165 RepID=A0A217EER9_9GAMM|nr:hypothetical protein [Acinetobacter apis]SNQ28827.1 hypothetical protein SAMN05444584_0755 [Acinetobacter apis]